MKSVPPPPFWFATLITFDFGIGSFLLCINLAAYGEMGGYVGGKKGRWLVCQRPLCDIQFMKYVRLSPKTLILQGFAGVSL